MGVGRENILELIFAAGDDKQQSTGNGPDRYKQALQNNAPWLLRYVTAQVILHKVRRPLVRLLPILALTHISHTHNRALGSGPSHSASLDSVRRPAPCIL